MEGEEFYSKFGPRANVFLSSPKNGDQELTETAFTPPSVFIAPLNHKN